MSVVDSSNKAHSIMGPECSFCTHRKGWHDPEGCSRCDCAHFDDGLAQTHFRADLNILWHRLRGHRVDAVETVTVGQRERRITFRAHCSCGKEWTA